ncbi:MAG: PAS domain S-box protein [Bacteroidales bacterium]|nr:PAS domain S-box protein [Bacteroidales bacterium]
MINKITNEDIRKENQQLREKIANQEVEIARLKQMQEKEINTKLLQMHNLMRYIIEHANGAVAVHDKNLNYIYVSKQYLEQYGIQDHDILGKHHYDIFPDLPQKWRDVHQKTLKGEISSKDNDPYIKADGSTEWTKWECRPWFEEDGSIGGIIVYTEVITDRVKTNQVLKASEERWKFALEGAGDGIWDWNLETNEIYFSDQWKTMLGYAPHEIENTYDEWQKRLHPDDQKKTLQEVNRCLAGETSVYLNEHRLLCKDKTYRWILDRGKVIRRDEEGKPLRFIGSHTDITERKLFETKLKITQFGIDNAAVGVYQVEEDGSIQYANNYAAQSLDYTLAELKEKTLFDIDSNFNPDSFKTHRQQTQSEGSRTFVSKHRKKDGTLFPVEVTVNYFLFDNQLLSFSFVKDISDQVKAENELKERERMFRNLFEAANAGKSITMLSGEITVNQAFCTMLGYTREELEQKTWQELTPAEDIEVISQNLHPLLNGETKATRFNKRYLHKDGSIRWADVSVAVKLDDQNKPMYFISTIVDITDRLKTEDELNHIRKNLENEVYNKTKELNDRIETLERFRNATIEREFRIKELIEEIDQLKKQRHE